MRKIDLAIILFLCASFCWPLLSHPYNLGRGDWDQTYFYHEAPQKSLLTYHQFPFWNPFYCGGMSLIGNPQTRFLSPSIILTTLLGVVPGLKIEVFLHYVIGMIGMILLSNHFGIKGILRLLPGIIFIFNGALTFFVTEGNVNWPPIAYLPYILLFYFKSPRGLRNSLYAAAFLALMIYEGTHYILFFTLMFLVCLGILYAVQERRINPFSRIMLIILWGACLAAPKLLPTIELTSLYPRITNPGHGMALRDLIIVFLSPNQYMNKICPFTYGCGWWAYGAYIGICVAILYLLSFSLFRKHWPLVLSSIFLLTIGLGNFSPYSPWTYLHPLPILKTMQVPSRVFAVFLLPVGLLAGLFLQELADHTSNPRRMKIIILAMTVLITLDLFSVNRKILFEALRPFQVQPSQVLTIFSGKAKSQAPFVQYKMPRQEQFRFGGWSAMYPELAKNRGILNGYEPIPVQRHPRAINEAGYRGEYFLLNNQGAIRQTLWSPNKLTFELKLNREDMLVINQNFDKNWHASPGRAVKSHDGLIAVDVSPADRTLTLFYSPQSFFLGFAGFPIVGFSFFFLNRRARG